jgi:hypothetical protein
VRGSVAVTAERRPDLLQLLSGWVIDSLVLGRQAPRKLRAAFPFKDPEEQLDVML